MMRNIFKVILFALVLNIATGIVQTAVINVAGEDVFSTVDRARVPIYNDTGSAYFVDGFDDPVNPGAAAEDKSNLVFRLLDVITLGYISKIITAIDHYMFGFINFLDKLFGRYMAPALHLLLFGPDQFSLFGLLKAITLIGYVLGMFELWTNKTIVD